MRNLFPYFLLWLVLCGGIIIPTLAYADGCTPITIMTPNGTKFCQQCCYAGQCQMTCF